MESSLPFMKQTPEQMLTESRQYAYAKISGESDPKRMPDSITNALHRRAGSVASDISDVVSSSKIAGMAENLLGKTEEAMDSVFHAKETPEVPVDETLVAKTGRILSNIFHHIKTEASHVAKKQGKERPKGKIEIVDVINLPHHWLTENYDILLKMETPEKAGPKIFRSCSMLVLGTILAVWGLAAATLQKAAGVASNSSEKVASRFADKVNYESVKGSVIRGGTAVIELWGSAEKIFYSYSPKYVQDLAERAKIYWYDIYNKIKIQWKKETSKMNLSSGREEVNVVEDMVSSCSSKDE